MEFNSGFKGLTRTTFLFLMCRCIYDPCACQMSLARLAVALVVR